MALALGIAAVYMWNGLIVGRNVIHVDLPKISSEDDLLFIFPSTARDASPYYIPKEGEIVDGRDMSLYDEGGYIASCDAVDDNERTGCLRQREDARRFVIDHWTKKRRGYIQVGRPCVDCSPVAHVFIEPDPNGEFHFVITSQSQGPLITEKASRVRLRKADMEENWRTNSTRILVFLDRNGKEIDYF